MTSSVPRPNRIKPFDVLRRTFHVYAAHPSTVLLAGAGIGLLGVLNTVRSSAMPGLPLVVVAVDLAVTAMSVGTLVQLTSDAHNGLPSKTPNELVRCAGEAFWRLLLIAGVSGLVISILFSLASTIVFIFALSAIFAVKVSVGGLIAAVALATILGYAPGLLLMILWSVAAPVAMIERPARLQALKRSRVLVKGNRLRILGLFILIAAPFIASIALAIVAGAPASGLDKDAAILIVTLLAPLPPIASTLIYCQLVSTGDPVGPPTTT